MHVTRPVLKLTSLFRTTSLSHFRLPYAVRFSSSHFSTSPPESGFPEWGARPPNDPLAQAVSLPPLPTRPDRPNESIETKRARLLYSCRKRGILETDLILSTYASKHLETMGLEELVEFDKLMEENDWDIYYWVTGGKVAPEHVAGMKIFPGLVEHAKNKERKGLRMPDLNANATTGKTQRRTFSTTVSSRSSSTPVPPSPKYSEGEKAIHVKLADALLPTRLVVTDISGEGSNPAASFCL